MGDLLEKYKKLPPYLQGAIPVVLILVLYLFYSSGKSGASSLGTIGEIPGAILETLGLSESSVDDSTSDETITAPIIEPDNPYDNSEGADWLNPGYVVLRTGTIVDENGSVKGTTLGSGAGTTPGGMPRIPVNPGGGA